MDPAVVPSGSGRSLFAVAVALTSASASALVPVAAEKFREICDRTTRGARDVASQAAQSAQQLLASARQVCTSVQACVRSLKRKSDDMPDHMLLRDVLPQDETLLRVAGEMYNVKQPDGYWRLSEMDFLGMVLQNARCHPRYPFTPKGDLLVHVRGHIALVQESNLEDEEKKQKLAELHALFNIPAQEPDEQQLQNDEREARFKRQRLNPISGDNTDGSGSSERSNPSAADASSSSDIDVQSLRMVDGPPDTRDWLEIIADLEHCKTLMEADEEQQRKKQAATNDIVDADIVDADIAATVEPTDAEMLELFFKLPPPAQETRAVEEQPAAQHGCRLFV